MSNRGSIKKRIVILAVSLTLYIAVKYFVPFGFFALYPLILLVTCFHELGHALIALLTGGEVLGIQINPNGSGYAQISGGITFLVAMGGYVGSAVIGNILLFVGLTSRKMSRGIHWTIVSLLLFTAVFWYQRLFTTIVLMVFAGAMMWIALRRPNWIATLLTFVGSTSVLYIIEDFNHGPSSDLAVFSKQVPLLPPMGWAVVWLLVVLFITWQTLRRVFKTSRSGRNH